MMLIIEAVSVGVIFILGIIVWANKGLALDTAQLSLQGVTPNGIALGLVLAIFSFVGFESATALGDEAKNPLQTIPRSVILSTILAGLFFIVMTYAGVLGFKGAPSLLNETSASLSFLAQQAGVGFLGVIVTIGAMVSFFACTLASINAGARILFTMARHGIFHPAVGSAHISNQTPHVVVTMTALFAFLVPASMSMFGLKILDILAYLGTIATYKFLLAYILVSIAAPVYLSKIRQLRPLDLAIAGNAFFAKSTLLATDPEAQRIIDPLSGRYWKIVNPSSLNSLGQLVGYKLVPGDNILPFAHPDSSLIKRAGFMTKHLWVTPYNPDEQFAAGNYPNQHPGDEGLPRWTQANRSIDNRLLCIPLRLGRFAAMLNESANPYLLPDNLPLPVLEVQ